MSVDGEQKQWKCVKGGAVNLQRVSSIVRDIGEPCLHQSPIKVVIAISKMLKPDKWQATFDSDGKILGFQKVLKLIILGGVDPSIRPEVWEFLLGCYALSSTAEYRTQLRTARRERYGDLIKQCQMMHSSIGTGSLAYAVGSKVMDVRTSSKDEGIREADIENRRVSESSVSKSNSNSVLDGKSVDTSPKYETENPIDSGDLAHVRANEGACDSSTLVSSPGPNNCASPTEHEGRGSQYVDESYLDFPPLPITDLFEKSDNNKDQVGVRIHDDGRSTRRKLRFDEEHMHSFQISNNADLVVETNVSLTNEASLSPSSGSKFKDPFLESRSRSDSLKYEREMIHRLRISDTPAVAATDTTTSLQGYAGDDRVSEWLWTLHRIVVDVVRTDSHLEFYEDTRNLARMSDILAVYAWVDPATGYCQGMSDLLSPFVVLFEDNADAFWCFEMLLRRMRENFKMEGPTGVMKQLHALWHIIELTDKEMFLHLSQIGAESLHFAFRMLLVLFRRELSFNEALCMWEMIWAADFSESLDANCPEVLLIQLPKETEAESGEEAAENSSGVPKSGLLSKLGTIERSISDNTVMKSVSAIPFCGLTKNFWSRNDRLQIHRILSSTRNAVHELPVFCVAAVLIMNRQKLIKDTRSIDDLIKIFNDNLLKIRVKRCVRTAIKLRKKYLYKVIKGRTPVIQNGD